MLEAKRSSLHNTIKSEADRKHASALKRNGGSDKEYAPTNNHPTPIQEGGGLLRGGNQVASKTLVFQDENLRHGFAQVPNMVLRDPLLSGNEKVLYALLLSYAWRNDECFPGQDTLAHDMGLTSRAIRQLLVKLKAKRLITWKRQGLGKVNIYMIKRLSDVYYTFVDQP